MIARILIAAVLVVCIGACIRAQILAKRVQDLQRKVEILTINEKEAEQRTEDLLKLIDRYKNGTLRPEATVLAVNRGWHGGFVVLSIGKLKGAIQNAEMILERGNTLVCKVRITSIEPSASVADVIPGSLSAGMRLEPGDRAVFTKE